MDKRHWVINCREVSFIQCPFYEVWHLNFRLRIKRLIKRRVKSRQRKQRRSLPVLRPMLVGRGSRCHSNRKIRSLVAVNGAGFRKVTCFSKKMTTKKMKTKFNPRGKKVIFNPQFLHFSHLCSFSIRTVDIPKPDVTMETEPPRQPEAPPTSVSMASEPKRSIPEPPGMRKKEGEREGDGKGVEKEGAEKRTVFVSNLKMSVTKEDLEEKFSQVSLIHTV